jgi:uncharacterized protein
VLAIGEAKWGESLEMRHVERLERIIKLLATRGHDVREARIACFSGSGFSRDLRRRIDPERVVLVDLGRLYQGT